VEAELTVETNTTKDRWGPQNGLEVTTDGDGTPRTRAVRGRGARGPQRGATGRGE
jgi:hypothetical protein